MKPEDGRASFLEQAAWMSLQADAHIKAGAKRVVISAPSKDAPM